MRIDSGKLHLNRPGAFAFIAAASLTMAIGVFLTGRAADQDTVEIRAPYWTVGAGYESTIMVNNTRSRAIEVTPLIFTAAGERLDAANLRLEPLESRSIPLSEIVGRKAQNGNIALQFVGEPLDLAAQIVVEQHGQSLLFNRVFSSKHVYFSSAFEGVFYLPGPGSQGRLAASNATAEPRELG